MKKIVMIAVVLLSVVFLSSCTDSDLKDLEQRNETELQMSIDPEKDCPPNDRNCNGIPDDEE